MGRGHAVRAAVLGVAMLGIAGPLLAAGTAAPILASELILKSKTPALEYSWRVPPEAALEPALFRAMRATAEAGLKAGQAQAGQDAAEAKKSGYPVRPYTDSRYWTVAADTARLLALSGMIYAYTGGAHGNTGYDTVIWDKAAGKKIAITELFSDRAKARAIIEPLVCTLLADEQKARRGGEKLGGDFDKCPALTEAALLPYGGAGPVASSLRVIFAPYVAGPYVEGSYELTLPWPEAVKPLVKPEYRADLFGSE